MNDLGRRARGAHYRQAERAMLLDEDAAKRIGTIASELRATHAADHLVISLEQAAGAVRSAHREMVKTVSWKAPE